MRISRDQCICSRVKLKVKKKWPFHVCTWICLLDSHSPALLILAVELYVLLSGAVQWPGFAVLPLAALQSRKGKDAMLWGPGCGTVQGLLYCFSLWISSFPVGAWERHWHSGDFWRASLETGHFQQDLRGVWEWFKHTRQHGKSNWYWLSLAICFRRSSHS